MDRMPIASTVIVALMLLPVGGMTEATVIVKAYNSNKLNQGSSWLGGVVPGIADIAQWDNRSSQGYHSLGGNMIMGQVRILDPDFAFVGINPEGYTLALAGVGGTGIDMSSAAADARLYCPMALGSDQTWDVAGGRTLYVIGTIGGSFRLTKSGSGTLDISNPTAYSGNMAIGAGTVALYGGTPAAIVNHGIILIRGSTSST
jgi:autotransporter-associated beta strand protein